MNTVSPQSGGDHRGYLCPCVQMDNVWSGVLRRSPEGIITTLNTQTLGDHPASRHTAQWWL